MNENNIFSACEIGDLESISTFLQNDPQCVHSRDSFQNAPLHLTAATDLVEVAEILLKNGADIDSINDTGMTALHIANAPEMTDFLLKNGADKNALSHLGESPLIVLAGEQYGFESMEVLIKAGADRNLRNKRGETARDIAISREELDKVQLLDTL